MRALNIKQIFEAVNQYNNLTQVLNIERAKHKTICIYIDDFEFYRGDDFKAFKKQLQEEYIKPCAEAVLSVLFCGDDYATAEFEMPYFERTDYTRVEVYVWDE